MCGSSAKASISLCGGWATCQKWAANEPAARRTFSVRASQHRQLLPDRIRLPHFGSGAGPPDLDNPVEIHRVLEVQAKVGEQATEERASDQTIG
jgi:hypothetical protein